MHGRLDRFLSPAITGVGATLVLGIAWLLVRPALRARLHPEPAGRARDIVNRFGADTLAYFALRTDKQHWIYGDTLIRYSVYNGVCLVSPDPIGPVVERQAAWAAFQTFTSDHGWHLGVLGAGHDYRGLYEGSGMRSLYVGDEGIVDVATFSLTGGAMKGLRQAVNRVANKAYTISFHDPATIDPALAASLKAMMADSRKGDVERGFSMTLSRLFDPDDLGLWLAGLPRPRRTTGSILPVRPRRHDRVFTEHDAPGSRGSPERAHRLRAGPHHRTSRHPGISVHKSELRDDARRARR